ncbi:aminoacyl-tRNA hydrolase [Ileibacterium valens]|uniref:Peptidyl-tRNA hydrolase n=1 Tax=Ileibacterium valens TaxID=1862668 RepID=A0A1U7NFF8_9FIRM|nr:aminoacyl-tRNA hydrolase [Ileibacterium valens]OLU37844.1 aminoacyl-tRNA hydrolase [Erysipelotrichaceae bacterium NYU-BL-E8]OLU38954.1 aminoacyl-tRNA hydrolase [Ileibacterium valens]OLU40070.1 aminoacyl-tRNA hydrolase [Erysipelotrichaceae bacterium NYU-BL-F16]
MKIIVGLGNPGLRYDNTRHNAGFMVMDRIAEILNEKIEKEKFEGKYVKTRVNGEEVILLKPTTFMNNSGFSLRACMDFFKVSNKDILVIYDDMDMPVGKIRLRQKGSAGGHNGIKSVITCAMTNEFDRIRVGIGRDPQIPIVNYVLSRFKAEEQEDLKKSVDEAAEAAIYSISHSFADTMNRFNHK